MKNVYVLSKPGRKKHMYGLTEMDLKKVVEFGNSSYARRNAKIYYIPRSMIKKNPMLKKLENVYVIMVGNNVIDVFKNKKFSLIN